MLLGEPFFASLDETPIRQQLEDVIGTCVACKRDIVSGDEFDRGQRQKLNLGHTIGHAVEARSNYTLFHGECVAIGLACVARAAKRRGACSEETCGRILALLKKYGLPTETTETVDDLYAICCSDKKIAGSTIHLVVPEEIGGCTLQKMPVTALREWIAEGLIP